MAKKKRVGLKVPSLSEIERKYGSALKIQASEDKDLDLWIPSTFPALNYLMGGGCPWGKIIEIMGMESSDCDFSSNDFYFSTFTLSKMQDTSLEDCNLKRANFRSCITKNVSFRYSNPEEAFFRKEEGYTI